MILGKDLEELLELKGEIESTLAADRSMALELQYWSNVLKKIDERIAKTRIESIYADYLNANREKVMAEVKQAEVKRRSKTDGGNQDYQTPFTALKIDNIKKGMRPEDNLTNDTQDNNGIQQEGNDTEVVKYNDGTLSPLIIPFEEAGYL